MKAVRLDVKASSFAQAGGAKVAIGLGAWLAHRLEAGFRPSTRHPGRRNTDGKGDEWTDFLSQTLQVVTQKSHLYDKICNLHVKVCTRETLDGSQDKH